MRLVAQKKKKVWKHSVKPHPIHMVHWSVQINNRYCEKGTPKGKEEVYYFYFSKNSKPDFFFPLVRLVDSKKNRISPAYLHPSALLLKSGVNPGLFMTTTLHRFFFLSACMHSTQVKQPIAQTGSPARRESAVRRMRHSPSEGERGNASFYERGLIQARRVQRDLGSSSASNKRLKQDTWWD